MAGRATQLSRTLKCAHVVTRSPRGFTVRHGLPGTSTKPSSILPQFRFEKRLDVDAVVE